MVESFFHGDQTDSSRHHSDPITLLSGPPSCGKTSLLFQFAFNAAITDKNEASNPSVVFICNRRKLEIKPPFLSKGIDPSSEIFQRIQMKYVEDCEGIKKYFSAFHMYDKIPETVVIDDFGDFFNERECQERYGNPRGRDLAMIRILALSHNAVMYAKEKGNCKLLLSDTHHGGDLPRLLFIYKRWVSSTFTTKGDGKGSFLLRRNSNLGNVNCEKTTRIAKYSIALQYLVLEGFFEEGDEIKPEFW